MRTLVRVHEVHFRTAKHLFALCAKDGGRCMTASAHKHGADDEIGKTWFHWVLPHIFYSHTCIFQARALLNCSHAFTLECKFTFRLVFGLLVPYHRHDRGEIRTWLSGNFPWSSQYTDTVKGRAQHFSDWRLDFFFSLPSETRIWNFIREKGIHRTSQGCSMFGIMFPLVSEAMVWPMGMQTSFDHVTSPLAIRAAGGAAPTPLYKTSNSRSSVPKLGRSEFHENVALGVG